MIKVLQVGDPLLEKKSKAVDDPKSADIQILIGDLVSVCKKKAGKSAGLAAPQIGQNLQMFIARRVDLEDKYKRNREDIPEELSKRLWETIINPRVLKVGKKETTYWEGCLSVGEGEDAIFGPVRRPSLVKIQYKDRYGKTQTLTAVDFLAHIIQHEMDHLEGVLFLKHVENPQNLWKSKDLDEYMKKHGDMPEIV